MPNRHRAVASCVLLVVVLVAALESPTRSQTGAAEAYDLVLLGGRVIDPETGLDAVRHVGIRRGRIATISARPLVGRDTVDVSGLTVAPGFIDLHAHGQTNAANEFQAHDGVTTALELEAGYERVAEWLASRAGRALLNFGATVSHERVRRRALRRLGAGPPGAPGAWDESPPYGPELEDRASEATRYAPVPASQLGSIVEGLEAGLRAGALGVGVSVGYYPGATPDELLEVYRLAAARRAPVFTHVREVGLSGIREAISAAATTGAPLHIVHLNSIALGEIDAAIALIAGAQAQGLDITTEVYPYTASSTGIGSTAFDPGWQARMGISYGDLQWQDTGERLTAESYDRYRARDGTVIIHLMKPEWIEAGVNAPVTMIGSDGMPYAPGAHPRSAGTFARVLGRYVRERASLSLMDALAKMTIRPARRLEGIAPAMRRKGRIQVGCDADITVFDPDTVIDTATFDGRLSFSTGIPHVIVGGQFVVRDGETVPRTYPGRPIVGMHRE